MYLLGIAELMSNAHMDVTDRLSGASAAVRPLTVSFDANGGDEDGVGGGGGGVDGGSALNSAPASGEPNIHR